MRTSRSSISTNYYKSNILTKEPRKCQNQSETIFHLASGRSIFASTEYTERDDVATKLVHWNICKRYNIKVADNWLKCNPTTVENNCQNNNSIKYNNVHR